MHILKIIHRDSDLPINHDTINLSNETNLRPILFRKIIFFILFSFRVFQVQTFLTYIGTYFAYIIHIYISRKYGKPYPIIILSGFLTRHLTH